MRVLVIGAGGHGQVVADILRGNTAAGEAIEFGGYLDDRVPPSRTQPVLGMVSALPQLPHDAAIVAIGNNQVRDWLFRKDGVEHIITPTARLSFSDPESAVAAAVSGAGFVRVLNFTVEAQIASLGQNVILIFSGNWSAGGVRTGWGGAGTMTVEDAEAIAREVAGVVRVSPESRDRQQIMANGLNWNTQMLGEGPEYLESTRRAVEFLKKQFQMAP